MKVEEQKRDRKKWLKTAIEIESKHSQAKALSVANKIKLEYEPCMQYGNDPDGQGHLYYGSIDDDDDGNDGHMVIRLDDRLSDSLQLQVVTQLKRISTYILAILDDADRVEVGRPDWWPDWRVTVSEPGYDRATGFGFVSAVEAYRVAAGINDKAGAVVATIHKEKVAD